MNLRVVLAVAIVLAVGAGLVAVFGPADSTGVDRGVVGALLPERKPYASNDPVRRGCELDKTLLKRVWRGHDAEHAEDVLMVARHPNVSSSFDIPNHSGPWDYLQKVPLILYGPERIKPAGRLEEPADLRDVFPTTGVLAGVDLPDRSGRVLSSALKGNLSGRTKLILVVVWDGVGRNVLEEWPDRWPNLQRLEQEGTSYVQAIVGSSPSITPATHSTLGTGEYPLINGVTGIKYRASNGTIRNAFSGRDPRDLKITTFGDEIDRALGNAPLVGMLAWKSWHLGMLGLGTALDGGDADLLGIIGHTEDITGNPEFFSTPSYLQPFPGLEKRAEQLDRQDGQVDGEWRGRPILEKHDNPAWVEYQTDALLTILQNEGYGDDEVTDVFVTNYKMTDIVGHQRWMDSEEMAETLEAQDRALGKLIDHLESEVDDYVVIVTADHGHTPRPQTTGGWPITNGELRRDVERHFEVPQDATLVTETSAAGLYLDQATMDDMGVTAEDVARYLNDYRLEDNWADGDLPDGYDNRTEEQLFAAAFTSEQLPEVMRCAFGTDNPPDVRG